MADIIKDASDALKEVSDSGIQVVQGWYRKDIKKTHVTLWDLGETEGDYSDDDAEGTEQAVQVTIFSKKDEVALAEKIKELMKQHGFLYEARNTDDSEPQNGIYMKAQRFNKFYEEMEE
ncbi:MAG: hypothetical protein HDQ96_03520 [Lachnospiraceae bacterium]|nr:hypothetical protein [Lachnospiraceae bacterium]